MRTPALHSWPRPPGCLEHPKSRRVCRWRWDLGGRSRYEECSVGESPEEMTRPRRQSLRVEQAQRANLTAQAIHFNQERHQCFLIGECCGGIKPS